MNTTLMAPTDTDTNNDTEKKTYSTLTQDQLEKLNDEDWLRDQYLEKGKSARQICTELGCTYHFVDKALEHHDIPKRSAAEGLSQARRYPYAPINLTDATNVKGPYWRWVDTPSGESVYVQQLLAIAKGHDPHHVFGPSQVKFKNNRRDDLRPENIELRVFWWQDKDRLKEALEEHQTIGDVADHWDTSNGIIQRWMDRFGLKREWDPENYEWKIVETDGGMEASA